MKRQNFITLSNKVIIILSVFNDESSGILTYQVIHILNTGK